MSFVQHMHCTYKFYGNKKDMKKHQTYNDENRSKSNSKALIDTAQMVIK